jgi:tetratricopeptide (TPR) repeat protein/TolB-like protein
VGIFREFQRRKTFQVMVIYASFSWLIIHLLDGYLAPSVPKEIAQLVPVSLLIGMPILLMYNWTRGRGSGSGEKGTSRKTDRLINLAVAFALMIALALLAGDRFNVVPSKEALGRGTEVLDSDDEPVDDRALAVMPLTHEPGNEDAEFLSGALTDSLYGHFQSAVGLQPTAYRSAMAITTGNEYTTISRKLKVAQFISGTLYLTEDDLTVSVRMIDAQSGQEMWSGKFTGGKNELETISRNIVSSVAPALASEPPPAVRPGGKIRWPLQAMFYRGRRLVIEGVPENMAAAETILSTVVADSNEFTQSDPLTTDFDADIRYFQARALSWLALVQFRSALQRQESQSRAFDAARSSAQAAISLDPDFGLPWVVLGGIAAWVDYDWIVADEAAANGLERSPRDVKAISAAAALKMTRGQAGEAVELYRQAVALDPLTLNHRLSLGLALEFAGEYKAAIRVYRQLMTNDPDYPGAHTYLGRALIADERARSALLHMELEKHALWGPYGRILALSSLGRDDEANALMSRFERDYSADAAYQIAEIYAHRGEQDQAFEWLEQAREQHDPGISLLLLNPFLKSLANDWRWGVLLENMNLTEG